MSSYTIYHANYYKSHKKEMTERTKEWVKENREKFLAKQRLYNLTRKNKIKINKKNP